MPLMKLPVLFSMLALFSQDKVNLFADSAIRLAVYLIKESEWNSTEELARIVAATLDQIIVSEVLDYKKNPNQDLVALFLKYTTNSTLMAKIDKSKQD